MPVPIGGAAALYDIDPDGFFAEHDEAEGQRLLRGVLMTAERLAAGRRRLLDIGSGEGGLLSMAASAGWEVTGLEPSPSFARLARSRVPGVDLRETDLLGASLPSGSFEVVFLQAVLEHLHDPIPVLREIVRVLKPGGVLYADVPNEVSLYARLGNVYHRLRGRDWVVNLSPTFPPYHVFGYSTRALKALYRKEGLEPLSFEVGGGKSSLSRRSGPAGWLEHVAARAIVDVANATGMGTYIGSWARKPL